MISSSDDTIDLGAWAASRSLLTRDQGSALRGQVLQRLGTSRSVILDLTQVDALSPSFADELFGGLETEMGADFKRRVRISCPKPEWKRLIASALGHRRREAARSKPRVSVA